MKNHPIRDYRKIYDLEKYLFEDVSIKFKECGNLDSFDFFCIVIWKSNRSKSKITKRLLQKGHTDLNAAVRSLTQEIFDAGDPQSKMDVLIGKWGFRLPMSSAILTVLYPDDFSVYDVRVCAQLQDFHKIQNLLHFNDLWDGYCSFLKCVKEFGPQELNLRDKDRWIWGKSFTESLEKFL